MTNEKSTQNSERTTGLIPFKPGKSGNPGGRPALSDELKAMRDGSLAIAIRLMFERLQDKAYMGKLKPLEFNDTLELVYDRCGLPKVTREESDQIDNGVATSLMQALDEFRAYQGLPPIAIPQQQPAEQSRPS